MLVKVGIHRINFAHVERIQESAATIWIYFTGKADGMAVAGDDAKAILAAWDRQSEFQTDMQTVNEAGIAQALAQIKPQDKSSLALPPGWRKGRG